MKGVGIDIVEVDRFEKKVSEPTFLDVTFTKNEQDECLLKGNKAEFLASRFAAKEAYMKSIGEGWSSNAQFHEIEVVKNDKGQPQIKLYNQSLTFFEEKGFSDIQLSISHTKTTAVAVVIAL